MGDAVLVGFMSILAQRWAGRPLAIHPESLAALLQADAAAPVASRFVGTRTQDGVARMTGRGTGVLTIAGPLVNRGQILGENWGISSYEGLEFKLLAMAKDRKIRRIVVDLDSPGGEAAGAFELAAIIRKINAEKPVFACINALGASAAYALASGARAIVSTPTGRSGSIGVLVAHFDISGLLAKAGVKPTLIYAGAKKIDGNAYEALPKDAREDMQGEINKLYEAFLRTVAAGRGARLTADAARKTEARLFVGADAKRAGLVDEIGSFGELLDEIERRAA